MWIDLLIGLGVAAAASWLALVIALLLVRPKGNILREALRILPDLIRLLKNLATDPAQPRGVRIRLGLLVLYLAVPIDLIPDFIPVLGYADDAIIVTADSCPSFAALASTRSAPTGPAPTTASTPSARLPASRSSPVTRKMTRRAMETAWSAMRSLSYLPAIARTTYSASRDTPRSVFDEKDRWNSTPR